MFDIGVRAGGPGRAFEDVRLTADTLRRIAAARAQIQVTVDVGSRAFAPVGVAPVFGERARALIAFVQF
jgi:hypothetical protein